MAGRMLAGLAVLVAAPANAQTFSVDVPAGPLGIAIDTLARQLSINIVLADPSLWHRRVTPLRGPMTRSRAMLEIARAAKVNARRIGAATWRLAPVRSPPDKGRVKDNASAAGLDIVVMASKRELGLKSMSASTQRLDGIVAGIDGGVAGLLNRTSILTSTYRGGGRDKLFLGGIADSSYAGQLQSVTGLYLGDVRLTYSAPNPDLQYYDLSSIEILQGPQGTLYGSGAMAGIVRLNQNLPERATTGGSVGAGISHVARGMVGADLDATINLPLGNDAAIRTVGYARSEAGYIEKSPTRDDVNSVRIDGGRATVRWWPTEGWTIDTVAVAQRIRARDSQYVLAASGPFDNSLFREPYSSNYAAGHLIVTGRSGTLRFALTTGVSNQITREKFDLDPFWTFSRRRDRVLSHEMRVSRSSDRGFGWLAGVGYMNSDTTTDRSMNGQPYFLHVRVVEIAAFAEGAMPVTRTLSIGAGARVARFASTAAGDVLEQSLSPGPARPRRVEHWLIPTLSATLRVSETLRIYLRYQEGRRPAALFGSLSFQDPVRGDVIRNLETGVRWSGDDANIVLSLSRSRWRDIQFDFTDGATGWRSGNLGDGDVYSATMTAGWLLSPAFRIDAAATINRSWLDLSSRPDLGLTGDVNLPDVADVVARAGWRWSRSLGRGGRVDLDGWVRYDGVSYATAGPLTFDRQGGYVRFGMTATAVRGRDTLTLALDNLTNAKGIRFRAGTLPLLNNASTPLRPLTVRVGLRRSF